MNRKTLICALFVAAGAALAAQTQEPSPYAGTSNPPPDSTIQDNQPPAPMPRPKPSPSQYPQQAAPAQPAPAQAAPMPSPAANAYAPANGAPPDSGIVQVAPDNSQPPALNQRAPIDDPDGDIVHPAPPPPGTLDYGVVIRARLLDRLSSRENHNGDQFRARVLADVYQGDQVLIPAGSEVDGVITHVSTGHAGGHGSMILQPQSVTLANGAQFRMYAELTGTPGARDRVGDEGTVAPGSRLKRDGIEYGGATGAGVVTGAIIGGPVGALTGGLIGAGAVTVHLIVNHPQVTLDEGTTLQFTLTERLNLVAAPQAQLQPQAEMQPQQPEPQADAPAAQNQ